MRVSALLTAAAVAVCLHFAGMAKGQLIEAPSAATLHPLVLADVNVFDGTGAPLRRHMTVVVQDGRIAAVCPAAEPRSCGLQAGAGQGLEVRGRTVMPGLITAHAHLALLDANGQFSAASYTAPQVIAQLAQYESYGVTTVVSLGMNRDLVWGLRDAQRAGQVGGATLFTAGRGIGTPGGFPPMNTAPDQLDRPQNADEAKAAVDRAAEHNADLIKVWIDSNHGRMPVIQDAVLRAVIAEAHARHLRVAAHVYALDEARRAVEEGVDILAHSVRDRPVDAAFIALLKKRGVWYIPTLTVDDSFYAYADDPQLLLAPELRRALPSGQWAVLSSNRYRDTIENDPTTEQHRQDFAMASRNLKTLFHAGVKIGFGTDSGALLGRVQGYSEHRELQLMVDAGLTPEQALRCATFNNAALLGLQTGQVKKGMGADLLVIDGDPTHDLGAVDHILAVIHNGVLMKQ